MSLAEVGGLDDGESGEWQGGGHERTFQGFDAGALGIAHLHR
jgi:hypothetical protein